MVAFQRRLEWAIFVRKMKHELYDKLGEMCKCCDVSPRIECIIMELMEDAYQNGREDAMEEKEN